MTKLALIWCMRATYQRTSIALQVACNFALLESMYVRSVFNREEGFVIFSDTMLGVIRHYPQRTCPRVDVISGWSPWLRKDELHKVIRWVVLDLRPAISH